MVDDERRGSGELVQHRAVAAMRVARTPEAAAEAFPAAFEPCLAVRDNAFFVLASARLAWGNCKFEGKPERDRQALVRQLLMARDAILALYEVAALEKREEAAITSELELPPGTRTLNAALQFWYEVAGGRGAGAGSGRKRKYQVQHFPRETAPRASLRTAAKIALGAMWELGVRGA
jgi:hypothetical protein